jgi:hypothetical protein
LKILNNSIEEEVAMNEMNEPFDFEGRDEEPEIWDEHQWEAFMRESDKRTEKYSRLLEKYQDHPDCEKIVAKEMGWDWLEEALEAQERGEVPEEERWDDFGEYEMEAGEEWKRTTGYESFEFDSVKNLPAYQKAYQYTLDAIGLIQSRLEEATDESVRSFAESVTIPSAKIAGGFAMGFERESLGGNIANCKRGLVAANRTLTALQEMRDKKIIDQEVFRDFYSRGKEVRDELAIYIVELRERFRRGIP